MQSKYYKGKILKLKQEKLSNIKKLECLPGKNWSKETIKKSVYDECPVIGDDQHVGEYVITKSEMIDDGVSDDELEECFMNKQWIKELYYKIDQKYNQFEKKTRQKNKS